MSLKELLGDSYKEDMTIKEAEELLKDRKLVDLSTGKYVDKEKYDRMATAYKEKESAFDELSAKTQNYDELEKYKTENELAKKHDEVRSKLKEAGFKEEMLDYGMYLVEQGTIKNDEKIVENTKLFLGEHKQYGSAVSEPNPAPAPQPSVVSTGVNKGANEETYQEPKIGVRHPWNNN